MCIPHMIALCNKKKNEREESAAKQIIRVNQLQMNEIRPTVPHITIDRQMIFITPHLPHLYHGATEY